jgi:hypothetical protein
MPGAHSAAKSRFERYLTAHGHRVAAEPGAHYVIEREGHRAICVVEGFDEREDLGTERVHAPIRAAFASAAQRLRPLTVSGLPLIAVFANPDGADVLLNDWHVRRALRGDRRSAQDTAASPISGVVVVHERAHAADWHDQVAATVGAEHPHLDGSDELERALRHAVQTAENEGGIPPGKYQWVEVFELHQLSAAPPIAPSLFAGERDQRFGEQPFGAGYGFVAAGRPAGLP